MKKILILTMILCFIMAGVAFAASIKDSKHDMSAGGSGTLSSAGVEICAYCHHPHYDTSTADDLPLWTRSSTTATFTIYASSTLTGTTGAPAGVSLACLSCHDGTIGMDEYYGGSGSDGTKITGSAKLGTDLRDDHPISITYIDGGTSELNADDGSGKTVTSGTDVVPLFSDHVECASCHDVHNPAISPFLIVTTTSSTLCLICHAK